MTMTMRDQHRDSPETAAAKMEVERLRAALSFIAINLRMLSVSASDPNASTQLATLARIADAELPSSGSVPVSYETP
jgi:hypothetical protein